jgi:cell shape-determining protein MreC
MKMSYEHKSRVHIYSIPIILKIISIILIILLPIYLFFPQFLSRVFTAIVSPVWTFEKAINKESSPLPLELQNATIAELQKQNEELRSMLKYASTSSPGVLVPIIKKPPYTVYDSYLIDIKNVSNVHIGDRVYVPGNVLVGEIVEINGRIAKVKLYSSYGEKYNVTIGKDNIETPAIGLGGGAFQVVLPKDLKIVQNDVVIIPDLSTSVFGIVQSVSIDPARAFSTILFSQPINIYEQKWVILNLHL